MSMDTERDSAAAAGPRNERASGEDRREIRISVRDLSVGYGSFVLMREVNFEVDRKSVV